MDEIIANEVERKMREQISQAKRTKDYGSIWDRIKSKSFNLNYSDSHIRRSFSKACRKSPYEFYRDLLFRTIRRQMIKDNLDLEKISQKEKMYGIKQLRKKMERYCGYDLKFLLDKEKSEMIEENEITNILRSLSSVKDAYYDEDYETWLLKFDPCILAAYILHLYRPFPILVDFSSQFLAGDYDEKTKLFFLMEKAKTGELGEEMMIKVDANEFDIEKERLMSYDYEEFTNDGVFTWFHHKYKDVELLAIRKCLDEAIDDLLPFLSINTLKDLSDDDWCILRKICIKESSEAEKKRAIELLLKKIEKGYIGIESFEKLNECIEVLRKVKV